MFVRILSILIIFVPKSAPLYNPCVHLNTSLKLIICKRERERERERERILREVIVMFISLPSKIHDY